MKRLRTIVAVLIALAIAVSPMGSVSARTVAPASQATHAVDAANMAAMEVTDCAKMMHEDTKHDCPCCDTDKACSPDLCLLKCFKVFGQIDAPQVVSALNALRLHPGDPQRPPDWADSPQPPPPRV